MGKNYTLYIRHGPFDKEPNKSGLVNSLLDDHYKIGKKINRAFREHITEATPVLKAKYSDPLPEPSYTDAPKVKLGMACCVLKNPCRHWTFDSDSGAWMNTLTGERKEV